MSFMRQFEVRILVNIGSTFNVLWYNRPELKSTILEFMPPRQVPIVLGLFVQSHMKPIYTTARGT